MTPLTHRETRDFLNALIDNELDAVTGAHVAEHLAGCADCRAEYEALLHVVTAVREETPYFDLPADLGDRLFPTLPEPAPTSPAADKGTVIRFAARYLPPIVSVAALAASLMLYISTPSPLTSLGDEAVSDHIRSMMSDHLIDVVSSDHHTVKPWFAGKLDFSPPVTDFARQGFNLIGGRIDYLHHTDAAVLIYRHGKHIINLFIYPDRDLGMTNAAAAERGYNVLSWSADALRYVAVSDMKMEELQNLKNLLAHP